MGPTTTWLGGGGIKNGHPVQCLKGSGAKNHIGEHTALWVPFQDASKGGGGDWQAGEAGSGTERRGEETTTTDKSI